MRKEASELDVPTLLLWGRHDLTIPLPYVWGCLALCIQTLRSPLPMCGRPRNHHRSPVRGIWPCHEHCAALCMPGMLCSLVHNISVRLSTNFLRAWLNQFCEIFACLEPVLNGI